MASTKGGVKTLGKAELIAWAAEVSGVYPCAKYEDFKDGLIFLTLFDNLFPGIVDSTTIRVQRSGPRNSKANWESVRNGSMSVGLPATIIDRKGVAAGQQRPIYNMLVMFYFLTKLTVSNDFTVDFAHPIDDSLAEFLQSPASLDCLSRSRKHFQPNDATTSFAQVGATRRSSSPGAHGASPPGNMTGMAPPAASPSGRPGDGNDMSHGPHAGQGQGGGHVRGALTPRRWVSDQLVEAGEVTIIKLQHDVRRLERRSAYLEQEMVHAKHLHRTEMELAAQERRDEVAEVLRKAKAHEARREMEHAVDLREVRHEADELLARAQEQATLVTDAAAFDVDGANDDNCRAENVALRQQRVFFDAQNQSLRAELRGQHILAENLRAQLEEAQTEHDAAVRTYRETFAKCNDDRLGDSVLANVQPAEQAAVVNYMRLLREEVGGAKTLAARCEDELRHLQEAQDNALRVAHAHVPEALAAAKSDALLQKANATIAYLRHTVKRLASG
jgi:hypothetical protein